MAEASGGRTHRRRGDPPPAGFEDRDDHRTACASGRAATDARSVSALTTERNTAKQIRTDPRPSWMDFVCQLATHLRASLRLRHDAQIRLGRLPASRILLLRFVVRYRGQDDDLIALFPVHGCGNFVFGRELHRINDSKDFVEVAASAHGVTKLEFDLLVRTNDEHGAHRCIVRCGTAFGSVPALRWQHAIELCDLEFRVANHRVVYFVALSLLDISGPLSVTTYGVDAQADDLCVALRQ